MLLLKKQLDLGAVTMIGRAVLDWEYVYASEYQLQVSNNAVDWIDVYSMVLGDGGIDDISFIPVSARYVRVHMDVGRDVGWRVSIYDFDVYSQPDGAP